MNIRYVPCIKCKKKPGPKPGFYFIEYPNTVQKGVAECECHKQYVMQETFRHKAISANIWPEALTYNIDTDYIGTRSIKDIQRLKKYVSDFPSFKSNMVYMWGPNGTQKTTLAHWVGISVLHQGYSVKYLLMQSLLMIISGFEKDETKQAEKQLEIEKLSDVDLLIIDEAFNLAAVNLYKSGYQLPFLTQLLRERYEGGRKGILFISNNSPIKIPKEFGVSLQDFVTRNTMKSSLEFKDNYIATQTDFNVQSLFD